MRNAGWRPRAIKFFKPKFSVAPKTSAAKTAKPSKLPKNLPPKIKSKTLPGPESQKWAAELKRYECPQITYVGGAFPIFLQRAEACNVWDVDGNRYLDLTSAFAVTGIGHSNPEALKALHDQSKLMMHGMGDVHPNDVKVSLAKKLAEITPGNLSQTIFSSTGFEAVESAMKTAVMHTKKSGIVAFTGAYHGLGYGALNLTKRDDFQRPFAKQLGAWAHHAPYPSERILGPKASEISMKAVKGLVKKNKRGKHPVGAVIIEPIQGRGGIHAAPPAFMKELRVFCDAEKIVLIADEVLTGFGRTGSLFAVEKSGIVPDLMCLGKGMANGFPISACIGPARLMYSWGASTGDAIHTSTFLGNPLGAAVALAVIGEIESKKLVERSRAMGEVFRKGLWALKEKHPLIGDVRGSGLMIGMEFCEPGQLQPKTKRPVPATDKARAFVAEALRRGYVLLPSSPDHNVISITPPFVIAEEDIKPALETFDAILNQLEGVVPEKKGGFFGFGRKR